MITFKKNKLLTKGMTAFLPSTKDEWVLRSMFMKNSKNNWLSCLLICLPLLLPAQEQFYSKDSFNNGKDTLKYRVLWPDDFSENKSYPLVLFLHGAGERGSDNKAQLTHGSTLFTTPENRADYPAIVIFPQCPRDDYWSNVDIDRSGEGVKLEFNTGKEPTVALSLVMQLLEKELKKSYVDKDRVYVAGLSMGAMGTFEILSRMPQTFAAAIPICGGGNTALAEKYSDVPLWVFHGAKDNVVNPLYSMEMVEALLKAGGHPNFTLYEDANHNSWDSAFAEPEFLPWMFSKERTHP
jgi:predicted peptidase